MKIQRGLIVTEIYRKNGKVFYKIRLQWWYALYTAVFSCFSAEWYAEQEVEVPEERRCEKQ